MGRGMVDFSFGGKKEMIYNKNFGGLGELVDYCLEHKNSPTAKKFASEWNGNLSFSDTCRLAVRGWDEGVGKVEKFASGFVDAIGSKLVIDEYFYDVTGQDFDLARVLEGEPECWLNSEQVHVEAPANQTIRLVVNIGASCSVGADTLIRKGAGVVALVQLLERMRRSVEVVAITRDCYSYNDDKGGGFNFDLTLKHAGQDLDIGKLAYALMHPSMLRRLQFIAMESTWVGMPDSKGYSSNLRQPESDIYIPASQSYDVIDFDSEDNVKLWILNELVAQGIELKEGN